MVFEDGGGSPGYSDINAATGTQNAAVCLTLAPLLGTPSDGSVCIYFAIDNDMTAAADQQPRNSIFQLNQTGVWRPLYEI